MLLVDEMQALPASHQMNNQRQQQARTKGANVSCVCGNTGNKQEY